MAIFLTTLYCLLCEKYIIDTQLLNKPGVTELLCINPEYHVLFQLTQDTTIIVLSTGVVCLPC